MKSSHLLTITDFEATFAPEIATFTPPVQSTRASITPTQIWSNADMISPISSTRRNSRRIPPSNTLNTITTTSASVLDTPTHPAAARRNRLSFLKRNNPDAKEAVAASFTNGNTSESPLRVVQGSPPSRDRAESATTRTRSRSPVNGATSKRASYFSRINGGTSEKEDSLWVTSSDLNSYERSGTMRSRGNSEATVLSKSSAGKTGGDGGSVRKRLSLLKLGKKGSKGTLLMSGVREED